MVAALLQVHHHVEQGHLVPSPAGVQRLKVTSQDELVVFPGKQEDKYADVSSGMLSLSA